MPYYSPSTDLFYVAEISGAANIPSDKVPVTEQQLSDLISIKNSGGHIEMQNGVPVGVPPPPPSFADRKQMLVANAWWHLDQFCQQRGYANTMDAVTYSFSANLQCQADAQDAIALRDLTRSTINSLVADIENNVVPVPTDEQFYAAMPTYAWTT